MIRIISAVCAFALIILGAMLVTQQGIFAQNLSFDSESNASAWTKTPNATITTDSKPNVIQVQSRYSIINRASH